MIHPSRLLAPLLMLALPASLQAATFTVHDGRADREIGEFTMLYIDNRPVASFRLDGKQTQISLNLTIPSGTDPTGDGPDSHEQHPYALCGTITIHNAQGAVEIHEVNGAGTLRDPNGHHFEALGAEDFTLFYLADPTDPTAAQSSPGRSSLCHAPIS